MIKQIRLVTFGQFRSSHPEVFCKKKVFLEISQNSQENTFGRLATLLKKETLAQVFSCEFCEIFKDTFFNRIPPVAASVNYSFSAELRSR